MECLFSLVFLSTFVVKGLDSFDILVARCILSNSLEDIWYIYEILIFGCKLGGCRSSEILKEVLHEVPMELESKTGFKWKQR